MAIAWTTDMTTGARHLDAEHRRLVSRLNALLESVAAAQETVVVERALREAGDAIVRHFSRDEDCAARAECPALQRNGEAHAEFLAILAAFRREFERTGPAEPTAAELERRLRDWTERSIPGPGARQLPCVVEAAR